MSPLNQQSTIPKDEEGIVRISTRSLINLQHYATKSTLKAKRVLATQSGAYLSTFKGRGMEFDEARPYQAGDDPRSIDWRVTARTNKVHTKLFREERERSILLWLDFRSEMFFATKGIFKSIMAAKLAALLAWRAAYQGDRVGSLLFSNDTHAEIRPGRGKKTILKLIHNITSFTNITKPSNAAVITNHRPELHSLARLRRVAHPGSAIFLITDLRSQDTNTESHLIRLSKHSEVTLICIVDPLERSLPPRGNYQVGDGHRTLQFNSSKNSTRNTYQRCFEERIRKQKDFCKKYGVAFLCISTEDNPSKILSR